MPRATRNATVSRLLRAAAVVLAMLALVLSYAGRVALRSAPFADHAVIALRQTAVQEDVADRLTEAVISAHQGELAPVRPLIRAAASAVVANRAFQAVFRRAVVEAHQAIVVKGGGTAFVNVADAAVLIQAGLERLAPGAARTLGLERVVRLLTVRPGAAVTDVISVARAVYTAAWGFAVAAVLLAAASLWCSPDRRAAARRLGIGLALGSLVVAAVYVVGGAVVRQLAPEGRGAAAAAVYRAFLGGLRTQALILAAAGAVAAGAAAATSGADSTGWLLGKVAFVRSRSARSLVAIVAGAAILLEPNAAVTVVAMAAGTLLLGFGVAGAAGTVAGSRAEIRRAALSPLHRAGRVLRRAAAPAVALAALAAAIALIASGKGSDAPAATPDRCNGYARLCTRRLDAVSLAATHNAFASVTIKDFLFGQQDGTIADQLRFGIRGFLIDTYYGYPTSGRVRTDLASLPKRDVAVEQLGEQAVAAAESIRGRLGATPEGKRAIYLCHGFCELGAVPLRSALDDLRSFLVSNPGAVLVVINQDEGVAPRDVERAFEAAGLSDLVYRGSLEKLPTLREMVAADQRLVVLAENDAGSSPWYRPAYQDALQETLFRFTRTAQLTDPQELAASCRPNRGQASAPLFLLNNWIDTTPLPRPSNATVVNSRGTLLKRARSCMQARDRMPNLVAVDFYRHGDVRGVVNALNGVAR